MVNPGYAFALKLNTKPSFFVGAITASTSSGCSGFCNVEIGRTLLGASTVVCTTLFILRSNNFKNGFPSL